MTYTTYEAPDELVLWDLHQTLAGAGLKKSAWYQLVRTGAAPQPVKVTSKRVAWVKAEVLAFRKRLIDQRQTTEDMASLAPAEAKSKRPRLCGEVRHVK